MQGRLPSITELGERCCGCGACAARCSQGCIVMERDACGFAHPSVDNGRCVGCGACDAVCPVLDIPEPDECASVLWAKAEDAGLLDRSSSGGVFGLLACDTLLRGGVVSGAAWTDGCRELRHVLVEHEGDLDPLMRSKYVQSSVGPEVYRGIRDALRAGRPALFCGTACQVAGMRSYLGKLADSDLFLGVDVICHGVPSPGLWRKWLAFKESEVAGEIREVNFRSKITGWLSFSVMYEYMTEKDRASHFSTNRFADDWYMQAFLRNASLRSSCLSCPFKRRCGSDITLGDFWGVGGQHPEVPVEGGVSAVLANTGEGAAAVERASDGMSSGPSSFGRVAAGNSALVRPVTPYPGRDAFLAAVADGAPVPDMMRRWNFEPTFKRRIASKAKGVAKKLLGRA